MNILDALGREGINAQISGNKIKLAADHEPPAEVLERIKSDKLELLSELKTREIRAAITRLELGEASAVRFYSKLFKGEFLLTRDGEIPDSIQVDCPTFTLTELKALLNSSGQHLKALYLTKQGFPGTKVVGSFDGAR